MAVEIKVNGEVVSAHLIGELDHHSAREMREKIDASIDQNAASLLVLDFQNITFMDSSGIGLIMGRYKKMREVGGEVHVVNTTSQILKVVKLSGLDRLVKIEIERQVV